MEAGAVYIPMDRRQALARGTALPDRADGAALFADISGFTPLTEALVRELGTQRGPEELSRYLNLIYDALIAEVHRYGGSVISFSGDAITCWFNEQGSGVRGQGLDHVANSLNPDPRPLTPAALRAAACALAMQRAMTQFALMPTPSGGTVALAMKAAVAAGPVRRFVVGDPQVLLVDALAGSTLDTLAAAEHQAQKGEVILDAMAAMSLGDAVQIREWRKDHGARFAVVHALNVVVADAPWPTLPLDAPTEEQVRPWLLAPVFARLRAGQGEFLAELRPAVALFLCFGGIDYDDDPEAGVQLDAFICGAQRIISRYDGALLQLTIGDKGCYLYAVWGAPIAHEDDTIRAATAALELSALAPTVGLATDVQIGISQGRMRAGAYGASDSRTYGVLGDEVNGAARLMQAAAPGQILVSHAAKPTSGDDFLWDALPPIKVKGKTQPITIHGLRGRHERRTLRLHEPRYALPMVGRAAELTQIVAALDAAAAGRGQIIGISGEAGVGKSRLIAEALRLADERGATIYGGECQSFGTNTSYLVWRSIWSNFFGLDPDWPLERQIDALTTQLHAIDPTFVERLPLLGAVLNLNIPDNDLTRAFDAKLRKSSLEALLVECLRATTKRKEQTTLPENRQTEELENQEPASSVAHSQFSILNSQFLIVLEDCYWLDPLSHDLLEVIGRAIIDLPVLLVVAYRPPSLQPTPVPRVNLLPHFAEIALGDFAAEETEQLIALKLAQVYGAGAVVPPGLAERIAERAGGNPFYIEELLNYLRDRGFNLYDRAALQRLDLPDSLHRLVLSRIDQLEDRQRLTLRFASVIGRLFKAATLWGAYPQLGAPEQVRADLDALHRLDVTPLEQPEPELMYLFKHIVTQETAYESLPFATRGTLHAQIGDYIERSAPDAVDRNLDLLAFHYDRSPNTDKRRTYLLRAAQAAQRDYANDAAIDYYNRVLPLLPEEEQVTTLYELGRVHNVVGNFEQGVAVAKQTIPQAIQLDNQRIVAECQMLIGEALRRQGVYDEALGWLKQAQVICERLDNQVSTARVLFNIGLVFDLQGEGDTAQTYFEQSLAIWRTVGDQLQIARLLNSLAILACVRGVFAEGHTLFEQSLTIRRAIDDKRGVANSLTNLGMLEIDLQQYDKAQPYIEQALALSRVVGDRPEIAFSLKSLANVHTALGDYVAARGSYIESIGIARAIGDQWLLCYLLEDTGCLAALEGQPERALRLVGAGTAQRERIGAPLSPPERSKLDAIIAPVIASLGDAAGALLDAGRTLDMERALDMALDFDDKRTRGTLFKTTA